MTKLELFRKQQAKRNLERPRLHAVASPDHVMSLLSKPSVSDQIDQVTRFDTIIVAESTPADGLALIAEIEKEFERDRLGIMLGKVQRDIVVSIAGPMGLGKVLSVYDKQGGNVTTIHNAKQGIYARDEDTYNRDSYTKTANSKGQKFAGQGKNSVGALHTRSKMDDEGNVKDVLTGKSVMASTTSPDHKVSIHNYHQDGGFIKSDTDKANFATDQANLGITDRGINSSMSDKDKLEWADQKSNGRNVTNAEYYGIDRELLEKAHKEGLEAAARHAPTLGEKANFYVKNSAVTGVSEGAKMGAQQAFGMMVVELFSASIDEIKDLHAHGRLSDKVIDELAIRLKRVGEKVAAKWDQVLSSFAGGFFSGFVSNFMTTLTNLFVTTGKRAVRLIREGVFSLLKALKMFLIPPEGATYTHAAHEALKLIAVGGVVIGGISIEEAAMKFIAGFPPLFKIAPVLTAILVGGATALCMTLVCYLLDKMDLFGAMRAERNKMVDGVLDERAKAQVALFLEIESELDQFRIVPISRAG